MTTTAPRVDSRVIGLAHYAARSVLEQAVLAPRGISFLQSIALRLTAVADGPVERAALIDGVTGTVKVDESDAHRAIDDLTAAGLIALAEPSGVRITDSGRELYATTSAEVAEIGERVYAGISEADRIVAGRVLTLVTERANAELAALRQR
ncbi:MarR family transcriptional regulator [Streptomyces sp. NPDC046727]|uniref:MarR family transcriptional regulator n=1 Tax=Streptomyces sp. NPDC046727 TaxID=3155373 RepID=UPI0033F74AA9